MRRPWIAIAIIVAIFAGIVAVFAVTDGPDRDWGNRSEVQTITRSDGSVETITIEREGRDGPPFFFFPFGFLFVFLGIFLVARLVFGGYRRGPWGGPSGPGGYGPMRDRFSQWHREEHEKMAETTAPGAPTN